MHPADQVEAFRRLADAGSTAAAIAARFGVSERTVEKRLRLGNAAPVLLEAYRAGEIDMDTLMAFAVTTDQAPSKCARSARPSWPSGGSAAGAWRTAWKRRGSGCSTFLRYPPQQWKSLRTTNAIERLHGEFKRRVEDPMRTTQRGNGGHAVLGLDGLWGRSPCRRVGGWQTLDQAPVKEAD